MPTRSPVGRAVRTLLNSAPSSRGCPTSIADGARGVGGGRGRAAPKHHPQPNAPDSAEQAAGARLAYRYMAIGPHGEPPACNRPWSTTTSTRSSRITPMTRGPFTSALLWRISAAAWDDERDGITLTERCGSDPSARRGAPARGGRLLTVDVTRAPLEGGRPSDLGVGALAGAAVALHPVASVPAGRHPWAS